MEASRELFERCVTRKTLKDGAYEIRCRMMHWGVSGFEKGFVEQEAYRYCRQYFCDGECEAMLNNQKGG